MSIPSSRGVPSMTIPSGVALASYTSYEDAQRAVDHLSDKEHEVRRVSIVGEDLRLVERITGRLDYGRVAASGAATGAWFGLMMAMVMWIVVSNFGLADFFVPVLIGAAFGVLLGVVSYALRPKTRDFTSSSQVVAKLYTVVAEAQVAGEMRAALQQAGLLGNAGAARGGMAASLPDAGARPGAQPHQGWTQGHTGGSPGTAPQGVPAAGGDHVPGPVGDHVPGPAGGHATGPQGTGGQVPGDVPQAGTGAPVGATDATASGAGGTGAPGAGAPGAGAPGASTGVGQGTGSPTPGIPPAEDGTPRYGARLDDLTPEQRAHAEELLRQADAQRAAGRPQGEQP